jgi:DNA-binding beta-propeller fold protein YncE
MNFFPASQAYINGVAQKTNYVNSGNLTVTVPASFLGSLAELRATVGNPTPGGGRSHALTLTTFRAVPISIADFVYEPVSKLIYVAVPASATQYANTIVPVNPATGALGKPIPVGNDPGHIAVSDNGQYLYVSLNADSTIQRINLKSRVIERTFPLPVDPTFGQTHAFGIKVVPGSPQLLVVVLFRDASPAEDGISLYNDTGLVNWIQNQGNQVVWVDSFTFAGNPPVVYAVPFTVPGNFFQSYSVSPSGIQAISSGGSNTYENSLLVSDGNLLYLSDGTVWNPATQTQVGAYTPPLFYASGIFPYAPLKETYFFNQYASPTTAVQTYDQTTFQFKGQLAFPSVGGGFTLQHWGAQGFAFATGGFGPTQIGALILFKSSI